MHREKGIKELKKENRELRKQLRKLSEENKYLKIMVDYLRKERYGKKKKKEKTKEEGVDVKKKGAPFGHKGVTRVKPEHIDEEIMVADPECCPKCGSQDIEWWLKTIEEHIDEEIIIPTRKVVKFLKRVFQCKGCGEFIRNRGEGEMPGAYIWPQAKSFANYLRFDVGIAQQKVQRIFKELFGLKFHQTSVVGFETQLRVRGQSLYEEIGAILKQTQMIYIDETGWKKDGLAYWLWCFCNSIIAFYHMDKSRGAKVIQAILGDKFNGIIISDFLAAYKAIKSKKQKCLPHLLRIIERLELSGAIDKEAEEFCKQLKSIVKEIISLFKNRGKIAKYIDMRADIIIRCKKLLAKELAHKKAERLRKKLKKDHQDELYTCLFHPSSDFNNNFAERQLRPNVIMRKITYGNRSEKGLKNHAVITSLLQTAKLNRHYPPEIFYRLLTQPSSVKLKIFIRAP